MALPRLSQAACADFGVEDSLGHPCDASTRRRATTDRVCTARGMASAPADPRWHVCIIWAMNRYEALHFLRIIFRGDGQ